MKVLTINTYAGSLLQAAQNLGCEIVASLEDHGFGQGVARANFPDVSHAEKLSMWPTAVNLSETIVLAHPPCSAFSVQNVVPTARGVDSKAFECTKRALDYAMERDALAIAVESVMGALPGAWQFHQQKADENGYHLYRILQNGCMFGCQWRERFWAVFVRRGAGRRALKLTLTPRFQTVQEVINGFETGPSAGNQDVLLARQKARLVNEAHLTPDEMRYLFEPPPHHPTKALGSILYEYKFKRPGDTVEDKTYVFEKYVGTFTSGTMVYLDPRGLAPVLMGGSFWYVNGRCMTETGFKRIMGYPADYVFPVERRNYRNQLRMYLSKGVMPPVAEWILEQLTLHLGWTGQKRRSRDDHLEAYQLEIDPNLIADFRIKKQDWHQRHLGLPPLRSDEEGIVKSLILPPRATLGSSANPNTEVRMSNNTTQEQEIQRCHCGHALLYHPASGRCLIEGCPCDEGFQPTWMAISIKLQKALENRTLQKIATASPPVESIPDDPNWPPMKVETNEIEPNLDPEGEPSPVNGPEEPLATSTAEEVDPDPEEELPPTVIELAEEPVSLPEDDPALLPAARERATRERYMSNRGHKPREFMPPEPPPTVWNRVKRFWKLLSYEGNKVKIPTEPARRRPITRKRAIKPSSANGSPITPEITTKKLRGRVLQLTSGVHLPLNRGGVADQRRAVIADIVRRRGRIEFNELVQLALRDPRMGGVIEDRVNDYVRNMVRNGLLCEAR